MSLIKCPECSREVSDLASSCPHCGFPLNKMEMKPSKFRKPMPKQNTGKLLLSLLTLTIIVVLASAVIARFVEKSDDQVPPKKVSENPYVQQWAGNYEIKVSGYSGSDTEKLSLLADGSAIWMWIHINDEGEEEEQSRKVGSWTASVNKIKTTFALRSGIEDIEYVFNNGVFEEFGNKDRYLKRYKQ